MSLDFEQIFGSQSKATAAKGDRPKAQFWLNIGYPVTVKTEAGEEQRFVSLPTGIPLDTQEALATNSRNAEFAAFQAARNNLHDQFMAVAAKLQPGEEKIIGLGDSGLALQIRRVNEESAPVSTEQNPFVAALSFG